MAADELSTTHIDYLQRTGFTPAELPANAPATSAPPALRRLWRIGSVGQLTKQWLPEEQQFLGSDRRVRLPSGDLLIGLHSHKIPLAFLVKGEPGGVAICLGTWSPGGSGKESAAILEGREQIFRSLLSSLYPAIDFESEETQLAVQPLAGLVLGVPTAKPPDPYSGALGIDRLIRAMSGRSWAFLVLAQPVDENTTTALRHNVINELRSIQTAARAELAPSPLAEHYGELLGITLQTFTAGLEVGMWRTGVYLLGMRTATIRS